ncbi:bifunctional methylenetetrahydrofolate dehydrogenase/methenyltetrahydrofolate cyclohydrolase FolD [Candidatus Bathyarchaeota archaeon]|nr:MAG: bifunctional methylenetetrahydrofolate dehydrogenase/methenyltetrahydrofolate cyclohydrolase FolD [Candidatus Bathyarchaeota archaeon]TMI31801.1 MAG: bifunctional methylenetetrahydrofolate dehydrogenase/methenyltetrahydrofolate cyclohydrolase FolD [Candidatus Bathyarchaeota archaeon]
MTATILDGKLVAAEAKKHVKVEVERMKASGTNPHLSTVLVGDEPASASYLKSKHKACQEAGIGSENHHLPVETTQKELENLIFKLNVDPKVNGILVQLPLPGHLDENTVIERIVPYKDVDGLHPMNAGKLASGIEGLVPCTPKGIVKLLEHYKVPLRGQRAMIVNRSTLVGRPLAMLFLNRDATVTMAHSKTLNLPEVSRSADILVSAVGRSNFQVEAKHVKPGAAVVDVGLSRVDGKLRGDVDFGEVSKVAKYLTPVPGGVGPMTVAMLLENTVMAAMIQSGKN